VVRTTHQFAGLPGKVARLREAGLFNDPPEHYGRAGHDANSPSRSRLALVSFDIPLAPNLGPKVRSGYLAGARLHTPLTYPVAACCGPGGRSSSWGDVLGRRKSCRSLVWAPEQLAGEVLWGGLQVLLPTAHATPGVPLPSPTFWPTSKL